MQFRPVFLDVNTIAAMRNLAFASVMLLAFASSEGGQLTVRVLDRAGQPAPGLVVTIHARDAAKAASQLPTAVMDQIDQRFVPFILPVRVGTAVTFPNSDSIAHQVYSFSPTKRFELGLYRGRPHPPIVFDKAGVVVLGCNIHDKMMGYVFVTDATQFGKTDDQGEWRSPALPPGEYQVAAWSPLLARDEVALRQAVVTEGSASEVEFKITRKLRQEPPAQTDSRIRDY